MDDKKALEKVYKNPPAVWTSTTPPEELVELIETKKIKPCKVLDVVCGEGFYAIYLTKQGFEVTGIDISENAINLAKQNAEKAGVKIKFIATNVEDLNKINEKFNFILEWAILHHISHERRKKYVKEINKLLNKNGKYLSISFNVKDRKSGKGKKSKEVIGKQKRPEGVTRPVGATLYFSSLDELKELFDPHFKIIESKVCEKPGVGGNNIWNYIFMEKES
ncbi:MAG: class I SAM-dependent methyltransferase [Nanoarchaeota archaeon]|nr:class I SAM-dependent methyltransferase [Nanoarchaeota archaeon]MBU1027767.1 class I SAM-dependent methyltransferase [Nanoarchaeota archaeon]